MNELELIARLCPDLATSDVVITGAGDDCAVLDLGLADRFVLFKTDAVVEGFHFVADTPGEAVGHKALGRCLSDVAAMGGTPVSAVVTIGLPPGFAFERVAAIYRGLNALARRHQVAVVGGETTTNPERTWLSLAVIGTVGKTTCLRRSGAQAGDALFVTGELGGALAGKHLTFEPRLREGQWLAQQGTVHAMIDLSDGLATDLRHLLRASGVGAEVLVRAIPISRAVRRASGTSAGPRKTPLLAALTDGEDFELLFAVARRAAVPLLDAWKAQFPNVRLSCLGRITAEGGVRLRDRHGVRSLEAHGYVHFSS